MTALFRRKSIDALTNPDRAHKLAATLGWPQLMALGVGAIVGTGIYTLIGVGAGLAGPGVMLSFLISGVICACAALAYAEMATTIPAAGSSYTYSYAVLGEPVAWVVGWSLILEYTVVCSVVAVGWSGHAAEFMRALHWGVPEALLAGPGQGVGGAGVVNLPAVLIALAVGGMLIVGARESANLTIVLVVIKVLALATFVGIALTAFDPAHFTPFMPQGFSGVDAHGAKVGVMAAAAIIFFAFYGFDTISTAAEETKDPGRNLTIGIVGSMAVCVVIYMAVAAAAIGALPVERFAASAAPLVEVLSSLGKPRAAELVAAAAVIALPTVILAFMYGQSRIFFVMARDGLLPERLARVDARTGSPVLSTLITAVISAVLAGLLPLGEIAALANSGTLCAFIATAVCMMVLRRREPGRARAFRAPAVWLVGAVTVAGCLYLFSSLPAKTIGYFFVWNALGLAVYALWSRRRSGLARPAA